MGKDKISEEESIKLKMEAMLLTEQIKKTAEETRSIAYEKKLKPLNIIAAMLTAMGAIYFLYESIYSQKFKIMDEKSQLIKDQIKLSNSKQEINNMEFRRTSKLLLETKKELAKANNNLVNKKSEIKKIDKENSIKLKEKEKLLNDTMSIVNIKKMEIISKNNEIALLKNNSRSFTRPFVLNKYLSSNRIINNITDSTSNIGEEYIKNINRSVNKIDSTLLNLEKILTSTDVLYTQAKTTADYLNLRNTPKNNSDIVGVIPVGTIISIIDNSNKLWVKVFVKVNEKIKSGWVFRRYTTLSKNNRVLRHDN